MPYRDTCDIVDDRLRPRYAPSMALPCLMLLRDVAGANWWTGRRLVAGDARASIDQITEMQMATRWMAKHEEAYFAAVQQDE
jgi:hypothetical protein